MRSGQGHVALPSSCCRLSFMGSSTGLAAAVAQSPSTAPAWISYAALIVSLLALITSFSWGVFTWRRNGPIVRVDGDTRPPLLQHGRPVRAAAELTTLTIIARNTGRAPARIHKFWLAGKGTRTSVQRMEQSDPLPVTIDPGSTAKWYVDIQTLQTMTKRHGNDLTLRPVAEWGTGKISKGRILRMHVEPPPPPPPDATVIKISPVGERMPWRPAESRFRQVLRHWWRSLRK